MTLLFWIAGVVFIASIGITLQIEFGRRKLVNIENITPIENHSPPKVSIIIPARNEGKTIAPALKSVLSMTYANFEIIVVNDRSTDQTAEVLEKIKKAHSHLRVLSITELPDGWLGKSHALHLGAKRAKGEYLLFTDADILFEKTTLARAIAHMEAKKRDHISLLFKNIATGGLLNAVIMDGFCGLMLLFKPWKAKEPRSKRFMGVGAFNLVRADVYRAAGGHQSIAMHPIDDIMLGKVLKQNGAAQECLTAYDFVQVKWYRDVRKLIKGTTKNAFALYQFRIAYVIASLVLVALLQIIPFWAIFISEGITFWLFIFVIAIRLGLFASGAIALNLSPWIAPYAILTPYIGIFVVLNATVSTILTNGIIWRGTYYPLDALKKATRI